MPIGVKNPLIAGVGFAYHDYLFSVRKFDDHQFWRTNIFEYE